MIQEFDNFLTEEECNQFIGLGESRNLQIGTENSGAIGFRKAKVTWFDKPHPLIDRVKNEVSRLTGLPVENQEDMNFIRYGIKGEYKPHRDGCNRLKTALIYFNEAFSGGETEFPLINKVIKPKVGKLLIWENYGSDGKELENSLHLGRPVEMGTKYIGVIWIRNTKYEIKKPDNVKSKN